MHGLIIFRWESQADTCVLRFSAKPLCKVLLCMSDTCGHTVGASPTDAKQEEKDSLDSGSANSTKETSALVQLGPGGENTKELPDKTNFMGGGARSVQ